MARIDIQMDYITGEVVLRKNTTNKMFYDLLSVDVRIPEAENYYLGEIVVNPSFEKRFDKGFYLTLSYIPVFKPLLLRFRVEDGTGKEDYIINSFNNSIWFEVQLFQEDETRIIRISEYYKINDEGLFYLKPNEGVFYLYSGYETDLFFNASKKQNEAFLLTAFPSNIYQYPTTGVGLMNYINSNLENSGLAVKLKKEFEDDKMVVNDALLNSENGNIYLDVTENG